GPPGALHQNSLSTEGKDGFLDGRLHGRRILLPLPTREGDSVVLEQQPPAGHERRVPAGTGKPRSKASAAKGALPGRCRRTNRSAPRPQATVSSPPCTSPPSTSPGAPRPSTGMAASTLRRSPCTSNQAP